MLDNAVIFFFGDNGRCLIRGKQWLYDPGIHVPLIAWSSSAGWKAGSVRDDLVLSLDMTATTLSVAGIENAERLDGRPLFGPRAKKRDHIIAARDRCDMTVDRIRCLRTDRWKYIRNFMPDRPRTQFNNYIETSYPTLGVMKELHAAGKLNATQSLFMAPRKPDEELYDLASDPHEVNSLAGAAAQKSRLKGFRERVEQWVRVTGDQGQFAEQAEAQRL
jgi:arylsulfatase A-like enzyme